MNLHTLHKFDHEKHHKVTFSLTYTHDHNSTKYLWFEKR